MVDGGVTTLLCGARGLCLLHPPLIQTHVMASYESGMKHDFYDSACSLNLTRHSHLTRPLGIADLLHTATCKAEEWILRRPVW